MDYDRATLDLLDDIRVYGFLEVEISESRNSTFVYNTEGNGGGAYVGKKFVVKDPFLVERKDPPEHIKCPTDIVDGYWIQPRCKVFNELSPEERQKYFDSGEVEMDRYGEAYLVHGYGDCHDGNFGVLNGKLKQFDW